MQKLTFREYVESKTRLKEAAENTPIELKQYQMIKYCKLPIRSTMFETEKWEISLKPKHVLNVEWMQINENHVIKSIQISNHTAISEDKNLFPFWNHDKMNKWLESNTQQNTPSSEESNNPDE